MTTSQKAIILAAAFAIHVDEFGTKRHYLKGKLHRTDGPAIEYAGGGGRWFLHDIEIF